MELNQGILRSLLQSSGNKVNLDIITTDRYGRNVAVLYLLNGSAVQTLQVKNGWVYPYEQYSKDCPIWNEIKKAEAIAINNRVNIYSKDLQKPWEWRRNNK
jgi:endonuclease YncB( thermonuclease family)